MSAPWLLDDRNDRAVEVVTMLGDTVLGVKHCTDPRGGTIKPATWVVFGFGAACLLGVAIAFALSLADVAADRDWLDAHLLARWPAYAFRPTTRGPGFDLVVLGGLYAGIASLAIGLVRLPRERTTPGYRIGTAPGVDQPVADAPSADFPLVAPFGDDFVLNIGTGIECAWIEDGVETPLAELYDVGFARDSVTIAGAIELPIPTSGRIRARSGNATFFIAAVARPRVESLPVWRIDGRMIGYVVGSVAVHIALLHIAGELHDRGGIVCELAADNEVRIEPIVETEGEFDSGVHDCPHRIAMGCVVVCVERAWPEDDDERLRRYLTPPRHHQEIIRREEALEMARYVLLDEPTDGDLPPPLPLLSIGLPTVQGDLERWIVRRRIKNHYNELAACYQRERIAKPRLEGVASVELLISPEGAVVASQGAGMDANVVRCLTETVKQIQFPPTRNGGMAQVNYPFRFHAAGR